MKRKIRAKIAERNECQLRIIRKEMLYIAKSWAVIFPEVKTVSPIVSFMFLAGIMFVPLRDTYLLDLYSNWSLSLHKLWSLTARHVTLVNASSLNWGNSASLQIFSR